MRIILGLILVFGSLSFAKTKTPSLQRNPAAITGTSEVTIQEKFSFLRIDGDSAKALYKALTVEGKNNQGEAGPTIYFKTGKSYRCFFSQDTDTYACDFSIQNPGTGFIK